MYGPLLTFMKLALLKPLAMATPPFSPPLKVESLEVVGKTVAQSLAQARKKVNVLADKRSC